MQCKIILKEDQSRVLLTEKIWTIMTFFYQHPPALKPTTHNNNFLKCKKQMRTSSGWILYWLGDIVYDCLFLNSLFYHTETFWTLWIVTSPVHPVTSCWTANFDFYPTNLVSTKKRNSRYNFVCCVIFKTTKSSQVLSPQNLTWWWTC